MNARRQSQIVLVRLHLTAALPLSSRPEELLTSLACGHLYHDLCLFDWANHNGKPVWQMPCCICGHPANRLGEVDLTVRDDEVPPGQPNRSEGSDGETSDEDHEAVPETLPDIVVMPPPPGVVDELPTPPDSAPPDSDHEPLIHESVAKAKARGCFRATFFCPSGWSTINVFHFP